jgi:hypothetical protein
MNRTATSIIALILLVVIAIGGYYVVTHTGAQTVIVQVPSTTSSTTTVVTIPSTPSASGSSGANAEPYRATLTGRYLCLPHTNTSGPQTMECALGMQTDDGAYYGLDFTNASQNPPTLATGDRFVATGIVTPAVRLNTDNWRKYPIIGIFSIYGAVQKASSPAQTSATLQLGVGQSASGVDVTLTPLEVTDDSRCPKNVNCIWAGTVHVRTRVQAPSGTSELTFELGKAISTGDVNIALTAVQPDKTSAVIATSSYQFTFTVTKR